MSPKIDEHAWAVIMAGGSGTRFWPVSRSVKPKQLTSLLGEMTMIQATVGRLQPAIPPERILVITTAAIADATRAQLPQLPADHVIAEPMGRDTAPCVALAAEIVHSLDPEGIMILLPADAVISPATEFQRCLAAGAEVAKSGALVTYGIEPRFAATGYGYIQLGEEQPKQDDVQVNVVQRFVEKPDAPTAESYVESGDYRWNSGIFVWTVATVRQELATHCASLAQAVGPLGDAFGSDAFVPQMEEIYPTLDKISIDYALMENAKNIAVVTATFEWDDVGSWDALYAHVDADADGVRERGTVVSRGCKESLLVNEGQLTLTAIDCDNMTVVATDDAVLVMPRGSSQEVKALYGQLAQDRPELI